MSQPIKAFCLHYVVAFQCNVGNWMEQRCMVESKVRYEFIWILCPLNKCRMMQLTSWTEGYTHVFSLTCLGRVTRKPSRSKGSEPEEYSTPRLHESDSRTCRIWFEMEQFNISGVNLSSAQTICVDRFESKISPRREERKEYRSQTTKWHFESNTKIGLNHSTVKKKWQPTATRQITTVLFQIVPEP